MAYEPTQWRSGDTITSERLNKMEQGIAGSGDVYVLHTTMTITQAETDGEEVTTTYSSVELREDGLPICLIIDNEVNGANNTTYASVIILSGYDNETFNYGDELIINRSTGKVTPYVYDGGGEHI